jgi:hypothetical protein
MTYRLSSNGRATPLTTLTNLTTLLLLACAAYASCCATGKKGKHLLRRESFRTPMVWLMRVLEDVSNPREARMATKLIELEDGTLVEVSVTGEAVQQISYSLAERVSSATFEKIKPILIKTCKPIIAAWREISQDMDVESAEVELGLGFEGEGNLYVTKSKAAANLVIRLALKPKSSSTPEEGELR